MEGSRRLGQAPRPEPRPEASFGSGKTEVPGPLNLPRTYGVRLPEITGRGIAWATILAAGVIGVAMLIASGPEPIF